MSSVILPDPRNTEYVHPLSIEAYQALGVMGHLGKNTELLYGVVFAKMPKSPLHASIATRLLDLVRKTVSEETYLVRSEQPITCTASGSEPEPDVSVVRGKEADFWESHPTTAELVMEVAVTSEDYVRNKSVAYARAGVKEFWIVLVNEKLVGMRTGPSEQGYGKMESVSIAQSAAIPELRIDAAALVAR
jgi:Uma2 family endonuclease